MPLGTGLFLWLRDNEYARWIVGIGAALFALLTWDKLRTSRIKREATAKANRKAEKQSKQILKDMEEDINETVEAADRAAERVPSGLDSTSLPKRLRRFVKYTGGSDSGGEREG
jgi:Flp pilus assembly protein TadB